MPDTVDTGVILSNMLPLSYRPYYQAQLLDVLRARTIFQQYVRPVVDFAAVDTKQIVFSEVYDLHPAIGTLGEGVPFVEGAFLDGTQYTIEVSEHGNVVKTNRFHTTTQFWNSGNFKSLVREKLGRNLVESIEIMARNAFLTTGNSYYSDAGAGAAPTDRAGVATDDIFVPDYADLSRTNLESRNALGLNDPDNSIVCIVHPRQERDIRNAAGSEWKDVMLYADSRRILRGEAGMLDGVRYVKNNFCRLPNAGAQVAQTSLDAASVKGQGGPDSDKASLLKYVQCPATDDLVALGFAVGQEVTVHDQNLGAAVLETDPTAEHRVITQVDNTNKRLYFDKPLLVSHNAGAYITEARDLYTATVIGGPSVLWGVAALPSVIVPPVIDDFGRINRISWYGIFDFHLVRDHHVEVWTTAASTANHGAA
jgi:N4-gp56 family major capsid protein